MIIFHLVLTSENITVECIAWGVFALPYGSASQPDGAQAVSRDAAAHEIPNPNPNPNPNKKPKAVRNGCQAVVVRDGHLSGAMEPFNNREASETNPNADYSENGDPGGAEKADATGPAEDDENSETNPNADYSENDEPDDAENAGATGPAEDDENSETNPNADYSENGEPGGADNAGATGPAEDDENSETNPNADYSDFGHGSIGLRGGNTACRPFVVPTGTRGRGAGDSPR